MLVSVLGSIGSMALCSFPLVRNDEWLFYAMQGLVLLGLVRSLIEYRKRREVLPLLLTILSSAAIIYGINNRLDVHYIYAGAIGLLIVSVWNSIESRRRSRRD
jgi:uncharacterized membrane protein YwaF